MWELMCKWAEIFYEGGAKLDEAFKVLWACGAGLGVFLMGMLIIVTIASLIWLPLENKRDQLKEDLDREKNKKEEKENG